MEHGFRKYTRLLAMVFTLPMIACVQGDFDTAAIDNVFADFNSETPGCALGVVQSGQLVYGRGYGCLLYTSPSPRDATLSRMPSSA